ncbi:MAG: spermidine/putrescine ABC transporter permease, partial [Chloroflexales bacterium]|nr:spermidine/putrescine ABC transporter permease [Chloroflexales bacterium]
MIAHRSSFIVHRLLLAAMVLGVLLPFVPLAIWSFAFRWGWPSLLPASWSGRAWRYIASPESQVLPALRNSLVLALL